MSEQSFEGVIGNTVQPRLLQHPMSTPNLDLNISELQGMTGASRPSVDGAVKMFLQRGVVRETGKSGNMTFYAIDDGIQLARSMRLFNKGLMEMMFPELFEQASAPRSQGRC